MRFVSRRRVARIRLGFLSEEWCAISMALYAWNFVIWWPSDCSILLPRFRFLLTLVIASDKSGVGPGACYRDVVTNRQHELLEQRVDSRSLIREHVPRKFLADCQAWFPNRSD
jgi:hypothetical protein